jgi:hypothetical protein
MTGLGSGHSNSAMTRRKFSVVSFDIIAFLIVPAFLRGKLVFEFVSSCAARIAADHTTGLSTVHGMLLGQSVWLCFVDLFAGAQKMLSGFDNTQLFFYSSPGTMHACFVFGFVLLLTQFATPFYGNAQTPTVQ